MVHERAHDVTHVVGLTRRGRHQVRDRTGRILILGIGNVLVLWGRNLARRRQVVEQRAHVVDRLFLGVSHVVGHARLEVVDRRATQLIKRDLLTRRRGDDIRASHKHVRVLARHHNEIGQSRLVDRTARAGTQNDRNLGNQTRGLTRLLEDTTVLGERDDTFLDTGTTRILNADNRNTHPNTPVNEIDDLVALHLAERPTQHREILRVRGDHTALHATEAGGHSRTDTPLAHRSADELTDLVPHAVVKEKRQALAGRQFLLGVLALGGLFLGRLGDRFLGLDEPFARKPVGGAHCASSSVAMCAMRVPAVTVSPCLMDRDVTVPARGASSGFSIFMASRTATSWPSST